MSKPVPPCRFCGKDLRRRKPRIIIEEGSRGHRTRWACCSERKCLDQFASRAASPCLQRRYKEKMA